MRDKIIRVLLLVALYSTLLGMVVSAVNKTNRSYKNKPKFERVETRSSVKTIKFGDKFIKVSLCLAPLLEEYVELANKYKIDLSLLDETAFISHDNIYRHHGRSAFGITYRDRMIGYNHIIIDNSVSHATQTFVKVVLYHELFHLLSESGHVKNPKHPYILRQGGDINVEYAIKNFDKDEIKEYFRFLKKVQDKKIKI